MKEIKDINTVTAPFTVLLDDIADTGTDVMHPDGFASRNKAAYQTVAQGLQEYLFDDKLYMLNRYFEARDKLQELLDCVNDRIKILKQVQDDERINQIGHVSSQLSDLISFIQPDNLIKP